MLHKLKTLLPEEEIKGLSHYFFLAIMIVLFTGTMYSSSKPDTSSQQNISGIVKDADGIPILGVTVLVKGTNQGTTTNFEGEFSIEASPADTLVFSFIGYDTVEELVGNRDFMEVSMASNIEDLDQIVVVGYGTVAKKDLTGSVSSLDNENFNKGAQVSVNQMIQGRAAGVQITQGSAQPGGGFSVRIRGATSITAGNEPLYVIDGLPGAPLNAVNPGDIKSIEILKDASATAIYGSRGANGVIIITTKEGQAGKLQVNYDVYGGIQDVDHKLDLLNGQEYANFINDIRSDRDQDPLFTPEQITNIGEGTDWQEEIFRPALVQNHQFSVSGGSEQTKFYTSLNYYDQEGVVISSGIKRYSARVNLTHTSDRFNFGVNLNTSVVQDDDIPLGTGLNIQAGVIGSALQYDPTLSVFDENGEYTQSGNLDLNNPVALARTIEPVAETDRTFGTVYAEYEFFEGFSAKVNLGADRSNTRSSQFSAPVTKLGQQGNGTASINQSKNTSYLAEFTTNYENDFGDIHSLKGLLGVSYQEFNFEGFNAGSQNFPTTQFGVNNLGAGDQDSFFLGSRKAKNQLLSYIGRLNYTLLDRYLLTATIRADGSSRFGNDNKYGYFPSLALGWRISDETFLADSDNLSNLKLRASYGITGNQEIGNYNSLVLLGTVGDAVFNGERFTSIAPLNLANPDLKWEETSQFDIGLDFGFFKSRISGTLDYYEKETSDLLLNLPVPLTSGFGFTSENVGDTKNKGFEAYLETRNFVGDFNWTTTFNFSTVSNEVVSLGELPSILQGNVRFLNDFTILRKGDPINSYWGYQVEGVFRDQTEIDNSAQPGATPGDLRFQDADGNGTINAADRVILGDPFPDFSMGLSNSFSYKGIMLDFFFEGVFGNELLNFTRIDSESPIELLRNRQDFVLDRFTTGNVNSPNPSYATLLGDRAINSRVVEDGSYIRLKNLRIAYDFKNYSLKPIERLTIYANAQNVFTITDYSGFNPDVSSFGSSNLRIDYNSYPLARTITLGLNIGF